VGSQDAKASIAQSHDTTIFNCLLRNISRRPEVVKQKLYGETSRGYTCFADVAGMAHPV